MSAKTAGQFQLVKEKGWRRGLGNLLQGEYSAWFKSSRWWKHLLMWFAIINGMMGMMIYATARAAKDGNAGPPMFFMYGMFGGMFVAFGVMIIMQRVLVGEKHSGTAAWVLSKPVARTSFIISKLLANSLGVLVYEMLTGQKPYRAATTRAMLELHINGPIPELGPDHQTLQPILKRLMAKDREQRYPSAQAVLDDLELRGI